ncbi:type IV pilus secretin PilQ [Halomonas aquamarina]|uniref:Type IV pilus secretin PilQ n=1 Tax=Vreelandella aquamarina TaxID=77097 RepID=A0ACC5VUI1_9GAMM|nr:type IV pilus secretin PilQ [Halomonas aquamarina]MBZ5487194.1 type IV pilus secretin PilQ [Halomonas aquamarina]
MAVLMKRVTLVVLLLMPCAAMASVLTALDVHRQSDNEVRLDLQFSGEVAALQSHRLQDPPQLMLDLANTQNGLGQRHIGVGQAGVGRISVLEGGGRTRLVVGLTRPLDYTTQRVGDQLQVTLRESSSALSRRPSGQGPRSSIEAAEPARFNGEKLSLNVQDMEIRAVLARLAEFTGMNLIASDSVTGRITLNLNEVPWDQALALILQTQGLASREHDNVILVAPAGELAGLERQEADTLGQPQALAPLVNELIEIKYARAEELAPLVRGGDGFGLLTERGRISVDPRTNALLIQDTAEQVARIKRTLERLDVPVRQVQIEARIVIARDTASRELGVNWGASSTRGFQAAENGNFGPRNINPAGLNRARGGLAVDLGSSSGASTGFSFGYLSGDILLDLELRALESEGKSQTISQPRVITANQRTAIIRQGEERAFQSVDVQGNPDTQFKEAELSLEVTPQITPDNRIIMDLMITNDSFRESGFGGEPPIDTNQIETQVLVDNGQTVVLGGILTTEQLSQMAKTPFLGDIPWLGQLFRYTEESNEKVELLVFITPRLLDDGLAVR